MQITEARLKEIIQEELNEELSTILPLTLVGAIAASAIAGMVHGKVEDLKQRYIRAKKRKDDIAGNIEHDENVIEILDMLKSDRTMLRLITTKNLKDAIVHARALLRKKKVENPVGIAQAIKKIKDIFY